MATNFPTSLDALTNPTSSNKLSDAGVLHADQHANANDAIEALQAKVGINSSAVTTSLDYKVTNLLAPKASPIFTGTVTLPLTTAGYVTTTSGGVIGSTASIPVANGGTGATTANAGLTNLTGYTTTATAGGTTILTNTSSHYQLFTGTSNQTVQLPATSTLQTGWTFHICNNSTGTLTINSSGSNAVIAVPSQTTAMVTCIGTTLTTAADWESGLTDFSTSTGTGSVVLSNSPTFTGAITSTSATLARGYVAGTATTYTVLSTDTHISWSATATTTFTLPTATLGRELYIRNTTAFAINSASANVLPLTSNTAGTAILAATAGKFAKLVGNGTNWVVMMAN